MSIRSNVDAHRLNERITFQRDHGTQDASGDTPEDWRLLKACWASVDGEKGREAALGGGIKSESVYTIWVRADIVHRFAITPADRIVWKTRLLNIESIPDQQLRGRLLAIVCTAGVNRG